MLPAAAMLRRGHDIDRVAAVSEVPAALLDLMSEELRRTAGGVAGVLPGGSGLKRLTRSSMTHGP
jgi:hypothetical protein